MKNKKLSLMVVAGFAVAALAGTSAFAEDRHTNETRGHSNGSGVVSRHSAGEARNRSEGNGSQNATPRVEPQQRAAVDRRSTEGTYDRGNSNRGTYDRGTYDRGNNGGVTNIDRERTQAIESDARRGGDSYRNGNRNDGYRNGSSNRNDGYRNGSNNRNDSYRNGNRGGSYGYGNRQPYYAHGRVTRIDPWNGGFRIYVGGAPFPFFVSDSYYRRNHWRVGIDIQLGGYYNPLGYYDYYDGVYDGRAYSNGALRGTVESVDYRRDTFVLRNDATGSFVTVAARSRRDEVRPGDYVELAGDWSRSGIFEAYRVDLIDAYRR
jgi:hypothetical protein